MRKVTSFNFITLNGFFKDADNSVSWHQHSADAEAGEYAKEGAQSGSVLLFGRVTYQMMSSFWPTKQAIETMPEIAKGMNSAEKIVFSNTLKKAEWNNSRIVGGDIITEVKKMKQQPGNDMTILGSGSIITQFSNEGLIDEYQIMLDPIALGAGTPLFSGLKHKLELELTNTRRFKSGIVLLSYKRK
jgi:dihydrofolate reductase